ncbi:S-adenosyl-L-methionine-dependent methyltransferase [Tothia fuscella]|uniref:S-adenosyl-L-methionine-dependent methyltransferase n=1 Tax=Tothia fuscella TaxID=1048955 RepID=A0A9P4NGN3_9PEZI|nr:S-adenosyl-L-methionine-dependent methyltransferase [Tothia fuscella]
MSSHEKALNSLIQALFIREYTFICPSPETQGRVVKRRLAGANKNAESLTDFFGWSLPIEDTKVLNDWLAPDLVQQLLHSEVIKKDKDSGYRSTIRVSNLAMPHLDVEALPQQKSLLYIHSSFPCTSESVFFGPDTYLFLDFVQKSSKALQKAPRSIVDVCCGSGAGAILSAMLHPEAHVYGLDLNDRALELGAANASTAHTRVQFLRSNLYQELPSELRTTGIDLIISNPPYIASAPVGEDGLPVYADGGDQIGLGLSVRIVEEAVDVLADDGVIMIYTGVAISVSKPGFDPFLETLQKLPGLKLERYLILNPDMWAEEIGVGAYADVGRIQVVGAVLRKVNLASVVTNGQS